MPKAYSRRSWWSGSSGSSNGPSLSQHLNRMSTQACPVWESRIYGRRARLNRPSASSCSRLIIDRDPAPLMDGQFTRRFAQSRARSFLRTIDFGRVFNNSRLSEYSKLYFLVCGVSQDRWRREGEKWIGKKERNFVIEASLCSRENRDCKFTKCT